MRTCISLSYRYENYNNVKQSSSFCVKLVPALEQMKDVPFPQILPLLLLMV